LYIAIDIVLSYSTLSHSISGVKYILIDTIGWVYKKLLRRFLPYKCVNIGGYDIDYLAKLLDPKFHYEDYESVTVDALNHLIRPEYRVLIVGAGVGRTALYAADTAREVVVVDASETMLARAESNLESNGFENFSLVHGQVGSGNNVFESKEFAPGINLRELGHFDLAELDIEGDEMYALEQLDDVDSIIVETHPQYGTTKADIIDALSGRGYECEVWGIEWRKTGQEIVSGVRSNATEQLLNK